jgi:hypothetical protein
MTQQDLNQGVDAAQQLSREARSIGQQMAEAQVAAARAVFNLTNIWTLGTLTPLAGKFEEGLNLYSRSIEQVQEATQHNIEHQASQFRSASTQSPHSTQRGTQQPQSSEQQGRQNGDSSKLYEHQG